FLPMGGSPAVVAVAPPGSGDRNEVPAPSDVRAFLLDGSRGYLLGRGVWHSLDRYPLYPPASQWVILTDRETQEDLTGAYAGQHAMRLTQGGRFRRALRRDVLPGRVGRSHATACPATRRIRWRRESRDVRLSWAERQRRSWQPRPVERWRRPRSWWPTPMAAAGRQGIVPASLSRWRSVSASK